MIHIACIALFIFNQTDPPFKPSSDFEIKFDMAFKQRNHSDDGKTVRFDETSEERERRTSSGPLPYLRLNVRIINVLHDEIRLKVIKDDSNSILKKKIEKNMEFILDLGYLDDIKDRVSGYKHVIQFLSADKKVLNIILIEFDKEGNYFVNGEKRGKV